MASIEKRGKSYRIIFRYDGERFAHSLRTRSQQVANGALARLEDNLRRVELGTLAMPDSADVAIFLLSDGNREDRPGRKNGRARTVRTLGQLCTAFLASIPAGSIEETTLGTLDVHIGHLRRELGERLALNDLDHNVLQQYVVRRSKAPGRRGQPLSAETIRKEIATLNTIWRWAIGRGDAKGELPKRDLRYPKANEKPPFQTIEQIEGKLNAGGLSDIETEEVWDSVFLTLPEIELSATNVAKSSKTCRALVAI